MTSTSPACGDASVRLSISGHRAYPRLRGHSNVTVPGDSQKGHSSRQTSCVFCVLSVVERRGQSTLECPRNEKTQSANGQWGGVAHRRGLRDSHELRAREIECDERLGAGALTLGDGRTPRRAIRRQLHLVAAREARHTLDRAELRARRRAPDGWTLLDRRLRPRSIPSPGSRWRQTASRSAERSGDRQRPRAFHTRRRCSCPRAPRCDLRDRARRSHRRPACNRAARRRTCGRCRQRRSARVPRCQGR